MVFTTFPTLLLILTRSEDQDHKCFVRIYSARLSLKFMEIMLFISVLYLPFLNTCKIFLHKEKKMLSF